MARAQGANTKFNMAFESTYGTAPVSGYLTMPFASTTLGQEQGLIDNELLGFGRDPVAPSRDAITADGDVVIPVDTDGIGHWLKALLGAPTTTGTTPKIHTFVSGATSIPSLSIEKGLPDVPLFEMYSGARVNQMAFKAERRGLLQATVGLIAQGMASATTTGAGTPTAVALTRFGHFNGAIKRNGAALGSIVSADLTYSNNLDRVETIRSDGKIDGLDPTIASLQGSITARLADTTLIDQAANGTSCSIELSWTIDANRSLVLTAHEVYLPRPRTPIPGPQGLQVEFAFQGAKATSPARMFTAVLTNSIASYA